MCGGASAILAVLLALAALPLAGAAACDRDAPSVRIFAAASLTELIEGLVEDFEGARVETSLGSSSELARQIRDGAPADVFVSASPDWIAFLEEADLLERAPVVLARNQLVCIAPRGSSLQARDPEELLARLGTSDRVAIADAGVPAGEYARNALRALGLLDAYRPRLVGQKDVRAVLHAVERGELEAGFVYATDARIAGMEPLFVFDPATHPPIEYRAAALRGGRNPSEGRRLLAHLQGASARRRVAEMGFAAP